jgi:hypothetical protein
MGVFRVISSCGNDHVQWNEQGAQSGDEEASAAIREAECIFAQECAGVLRLSASKQASLLSELSSVIPNPAEH